MSQHQNELVLAIPSILKLPIRHTCTYSKTQPTLYSVCRWKTYFTYS